MEQKVTITRTDAGATTVVMSSGYQWSKSYTSWDQALDEAVDLQLLNKVESAAAKMMPPIGIDISNSIRERNQMA